jgi:hypothetical protein
VNVSFSDAKAVIRMMRMRNNVNKLVRPSSSASHHGSVLPDAEWARAIADVENTPVRFLPSLSSPPSFLLASFLHLPSFTFLPSPSFLHLPSFFLLLPLPSLIPLPP